MLRQQSYLLLLVYCHHCSCTVHKPFLGCKVKSRKICSTGIMGKDRRQARPSSQEQVAPEITELACKEEGKFVVDIQLVKHDGQC